MKSNQRLLQEFRKTRSEAAFRELVERHLSLVYSVALRVTRNAEFARDVSQTVFLKLAQSSAVPAADLNLLAWLHRTTRNAAIDLIRSENRRRKREAVAHETMKIESSPADWSQLESVLEDVLANLSEKERGLILARYYQGHTHSTTAEELGISEDAARVRTKRALAKLQERLGKKGNHDHGRAARKCFERSSRDSGFKQYGDSSLCRRACPLLVCWSLGWNGVTQEDGCTGLCSLGEHSLGGLAVSRNLTSEERDSSARGQARNGEDVTLFSSRISASAKFIADTHHPRAEPSVG